MSAAPAQLAALHRAAFTLERPWGAEEFASLLASPLVFACALPAPEPAPEPAPRTEEGAVAETKTAPRAFALGRVVADEAELLTLACDPAHQGQGLGRAALTAFEAEARARGATEAFLEVAADNAVALGLYRRAGYGETGRRTAYYRRANGPDADACLMLKRLA